MMLLKGNTVSKCTNKEIEATTVPQIPGQHKINLLRKDRT